MKYSHSLAFVLALVALGVACGLGGAGFTVLLTAVEHLLFGFATGTVAEAATQAGIYRRFSVVVAAGCCVAVGWWYLRRYGPTIPSVAGAAQGQAMPAGWTVADTVLQVINVGAGGSIGREGAPRQFGAMAAGVVARFLNLSADQRTLLVACGAGAGLASIYNVPIGGALFALECVFGLERLRRMPTCAPIAFTAVLGTAYLATVVAWIAVPDRPIYPVAPWKINYSLMVFAAACGPLFGVAGHGFGAAFDALSGLSPQGNKILWAMPVCYLALACLAIPFPLVLGNGHALSLRVFALDVPLGAAICLLVAKPLATFLTVGAGAAGGKLTPSLSTGAAFGMALGVGWGILWPISVLGAAIIGAAAVLATSINAPITAFVLVVEFTRTSPAGWLPLVIAVLGAWLISQWLRRLNGGTRNSE